MAPVIILTAIAAIPLVLGLIFRVSALFLFVSVVAGQLFILFVGDDAGLVLGSVVKGQNGPLMAQIFLLFFPMIVTFLLLRKTMPKSKLLLHIVPLVGIGAMLAIFLLPLLASDFQKAVLDNQIAKDIIRSQDVIAAATCLSVLLLMWFTNRFHRLKHGKHH